MQLSDPDIKRLQKRAADDGLEFPHTATKLKLPGNKAVAAMLDIRMLFSCLVDADFLDTEAHFKGDTPDSKYRPVGPRLDAKLALDRLNAYVNTLHASTSAQIDVTNARENLWDAAGSAGQSSNGLFTLTAPTGSGKTLA
ncbi:CRISPR-associated helicase Cas3 domain protein, partial [mine drainage metagenome]